MPVLPLLPCVELDPGVPPVASIVLMHGLGADGYDFAPVPRELDLPEDLPVRWVFPHAPKIPVTLNGGWVMPAWYDILSLDAKGRHDEPGIRRSATQIEALVRREIERGIPPSRIVLAGFSQGGAMALFTALRFPERLAGVVSLSAYLPMPEALDTEAHGAQAALPIFAAHGTLDPTVVLSFGEACRDWLVAHGYGVEWHTYRMGHQVSGEELRDLAAWLVRILKPSS